jgi:hypothetical protein
MISKPTGSLAWDAPCPWCRQSEGQCCRAPSGKPRVAGDEHVDRWAAMRSAYSKPRRYVLRHDDERSGLAAGDVLVCEPYWLDPGGKLTVLYREADRRDPECNVYRSQVTRVRGAAGRVDRAEVLA